jgi:Plasmid pRiA4b ORF-3-like protein
MLIRCTKKLLDELKVVPVSVENDEEGNPLLSWHANYLKIGSHKFFVFVNDKNRYALVLYGLKAKDKRNINGLIERAIREVIRDEAIKDDIIDEYLQASSVFTFTKTTDRKLVARMNKACEMVHFGVEVWEPDEIVQVAMSKWIGSLMVGDGKNKYIYPNEEMYRDLEGFAGRPIFETEALVLKVTLELGKHFVWRRLTVPANITFPKLHDTLQTAFSWGDFHLHTFDIYDKGKDGTLLQDRPSLHVVCDESFLSNEGDIPMKMESGLRVKEFLSSHIIYTYDPGDNWRHIIEVERIIDDYPFNYPVCNDGGGSAPPEDVGGEPGYENFITIINDPSHPDHQYMKDWGEMQGYGDFDMKEINRKLK